MANTLAGLWLTEPQLRFDYENRDALSSSAYDGLRNIGPYDIGVRRQTGRTSVRAVIVGRKDRQAELARAKAAFQSKRLGKLHTVFQITIVDTVLVSPSNRPRDEAAAYREAVSAWLTTGPYKRDVDLAFVLHEDDEVYRRYARGVSPYYSSKAVLLAAGIPTQSVVYKNLSTKRGSEFESYYVPNILIACYAKIGGIPWVIQDPLTPRPEITLGVATTAIQHNDDLTRYVGICTIFKENGAFCMWRMTAPHQDWSTYEESLEKSIVDAIGAFESRENRTVCRIACHVSGKRPGRRELAPIQQALAKFGSRAIASDLVHITDDAILWLFDGRDDSNRPEPGFVAQLTLDGRMALMHTEGRTQKARRFPTRPLKIGIYSDVPSGGAKDVYQHLYDLRWMSWRSVATASRPASIDYPQRMARLLAQLHLQEEVEALSILPNHTGSAWFL